MTLTRRQQEASTLLCAMGTILVISIIAGSVLMNCTARYNTTSKQIKGWKEALYAAEAGGDIAFNEVRKEVAGVITGAGTPFSGTGWTTIDSTHWSYTLPTAIGDSGNLGATVTVDQVLTAPSGDGIYRIRSIGNAKLFGMSRTGLADGSTGLVNFATNGITRGDGDSLVRKLDFVNDHFIATYGDGDMKNVGVNAAVASPKVTRRIELVAVPIMPINGAIKALVGYNGNGADSYDSKNPSTGNTENGSYWGSNPSNPTYLADAHNGNVAVNSASFSGNYIYGDITTNGGTVTTSQASGTVDNNVPLNITPYVMPSHPTATALSGNTIASPSAPSPSFETGPWYSFGSINGLTINGYSTTVNGVTKPVETFVNVIVSGNIDSGGGLTFAQGVNVRFYFSGNVSIKAKDYNNNNIDLGPIAASNAAASVLKYNAPTTTLTGASLTAYLADSNNYQPSDNSSRAGHAQFYGISPTGNGTQTFSVAPPGYVHALIYAPSATFSLTGNPDLFGAIVCAAWSGNGNTTFHFDKELAQKVHGIDYRIASYIEDVR